MTINQTPFNATVPIVATSGHVETEVLRLADALAARFEELSLIHELSESLTLDIGSERIIKSLLEELSPCIAADTLAIYLEPCEETGEGASLQLTGKPVDEQSLILWSRQAEALSTEAIGNQSAVSIVNQFSVTPQPVSYTHLTLPTIYSV